MNKRMMKRREAAMGASFGSPLDQSFVDKENIASPHTAALLAEYSATNDAYMHYDNFNWQVGSVLVAGSFVS
jgi:hypothetical protein